MFNLQLAGAPEVTIFSYSIFYNAGPLIEFNLKQLGKHLDASKVIPILTKAILCEKIIYLGDQENGNISLNMYVWTIVKL